MCLAIVGVANQSETKSHIPYCVTAKRHIMHMGTWAHMNITPSLPHSHTYFCLARFIVNITHHHHDNDRTLQRIYCYVCDLVGVLVYTYVSPAWNWTKSHMWLASRWLAIPVLLYSVRAQNENELALECFLTHYSKLQALRLKCSKFE